MKYEHLVTLISSWAHALVVSKKPCELNNISELTAHNGLQIVTECWNPEDGDHKVGKSLRTGPEMRVMPEWLYDSV